MSATFELSYNGVPFTTLERTNASLTGSSLTLTPNLSLGKPLGYSASDAKGQKFQMTFQGKNLSYSQVYALGDISKSGIFVLGN